MDVNGLHLTLGGITAVVGLIGSLGGIWRFILKPILDGMKEEQKSTDAWRREINVRVKLLEHGVPVDIDKLRKDLLECPGKALL